MSANPDPDRELLSAAEVSAAEGLAEWRVVLGALHARWDTGDFMTGVRLVDRIAEEAEAVDHHPDVDLRYGYLDLRLSSHDVGGLTRRDLRLARRISEVAHQAGVAARPAAVQRLEVALDTRDRTAVAPFWRAVLGMSHTPPAGDEVRDPGGGLPVLWFQPTDSPDPARMRFHLDIAVPHDVAEERVAAAIAAGGSLVDAGHAPAFWVLADAEGNKVCVCTWQGRD